MDAKDTWPVVKFLIAATGFKRRDARKLLEEIPEEKYSRLFIMARAWDRDQAAKASEQLQSLVGETSLPTLLAATRHARNPSTADVGEDDEPEEREPAVRKAKKRR
jgi:hypothetical protein